MNGFRGSEYARLASLLPELVSVVLRKEHSPDGIAAAGVRLGGLPAWGVEQAKFSAELISPEIAEACRAAAFPLPAHPEHLGSFMVCTEAIDKHTATIARFRVAAPPGEPLELLVSDASMLKDIDMDGRLAGKTVRLVHSKPKRMSALNLSRLFRVLAEMAAVDGHLAAEAEGLRFALGTQRISAPRLVRLGDQYLLETSLAGTAIEDLPVPRRQSAYRQVVLCWARLLMDDCILHTFLRRDQIRCDGDRIGASRWTGTCRPGSVVLSIVPTLAQAAASRTVADRARRRSQLLGLLAYGLGISGSLEDLADLCLALVTHSGPLQLSRPLLPGLVLCRQEEVAPDRAELIRLLRQLAWFRDLGTACRAQDLAAPWHELARETGPMP
jgi:hypothetical protein